MWWVSISTLMKPQLIFLLNFIIWVYQWVKPKWIWQDWPFTSETALETTAIARLKSELTLLNHPTDKENCNVSSTSKKEIHCKSVFHWDNPLNDNCPFLLSYKIWSIEIYSISNRQKAKQPYAENSVWSREICNLATKVKI